MFCFTFVSDHKTDYIMLYSVQLKNMYSYLYSFLKLSDSVRGLSVNNCIATVAGPTVAQLEVFFSSDYL